MAGAVFGGPRRRADTALAAAVAASVLMHLAALAFRASSGSEGAAEPVVLRPMAVRLISAAVARPTTPVTPPPVDPEPARDTAPAVKQRELPLTTVAPSSIVRAAPSERDSTPQSRTPASTAPVPARPEPNPASEAPATATPPTAATTTAYRAAAGLDPPPRPLDDIAPGFPAGAGTRGGTVVLRLLLSETGAIDKIEVVRSSPPGLFDEAALAAFGAARFSPGYLAGTPVRSQIMFEVEFAPQARDGGASSRGY